MKTLSNLMRGDDFFDPGPFGRDDSKIKDKTYVGVEIELENCPTDYEHGANIGLWVVKTDDSLRNEGIELVTKYGATGSTTVNALRSLKTTLARLTNEEPQATFRCGLHVHLNVADFSQEQFHHLLILYLIFEQALFDVSGERQSNIHSVPLVGAPFTGRTMLTSPSRVVPANMPQGLGEKYYALNLCALQKYLTVEFRHHTGTTDGYEIINWLVTLLDLHNTARAITPQEIERILRDLNSESFYQYMAEKTFPRSPAIWKAPHLVAGMRKGVCFVKELRAKFLDKVPKIEDIIVRLNEPPIEPLDWARVINRQPIENAARGLVGEILGQAQPLPKKKVVRKVVKVNKIDPVDF